MPPVPPRLLGARVLVTLAGDGDAAELLAFHDRNYAHLKPWMPPLPEDLLTTGYWVKWCAAAQTLFERDQSVRLVMRLATAPAGPIIGQINFSNILRGPFQACFLGYHVDAAMEGRGLMREALELALGFGFGPLGLHRIMANYIPGNERSARLLARLGFTIEGYARDYLFIDGAWRDHVMTARVNPDAKPPPGPLRTPATGRSRPRTQL